LSFPRVTRRLPELAGLLLIVLALTAGAAAPARAGDDPAATDVTPTTAFDDGDQRIIPRPDSGREPTEAGDRGGALQLALLGLIVVGVGVAGVRILRQTSRVGG
jgi:hypothetical protein